jgi:hypothetical protein
MSLANRLILGSLLVALGAALVPVAVGQEMEPRAYSPAPIGTQFVFLGYGHQSGDARIGATFSLPLTPQQSLKLAWAKGVTTRIGGDLNMFVVGWQRAW